MAEYVYYVVCEDCPPYETVTASNVRASGVRSGHRVGSASVKAVNPVAEYSDNMWCRRGSTITAGKVRVKGIRADGFED